MAFISLYAIFFTACLRSSSGTSAFPASSERVGVFHECEQIVLPGLAWCHWVVLGGQVTGGKCLSFFCLLYMCMIGVR